jgi:dTDP-4-amino-4,6-dideoxygalactose transaminase
MIPCSNPLGSYLARRTEVDAAIRRVLEKGVYILGDEVQAFETEFANYVGVPNAVGVASGTEALYLALTACGIGPGDEVITVSLTATPTAAAIDLSGASPVFIDIDPNFYTMDPTRLESAITPRTKAIVPVHLYGQPADLERILEIANRYQIKVIEDCAQAHGTRYRDRMVGSWGDFGCFSFYPTKNLGALGDGGIVVTRHDAFNGVLREIRDSGSRGRVATRRPSLNSRLDEIQAAVLRVKLNYLERDNDARRQIAGWYQNHLAGTGLRLPQEREGGHHVYHVYGVRTPQREVLRECLSQKGIGTLIHYPLPVHLQPVYKEACDVTLLETEAMARETLSLPMYPDVKESDVKNVADAIKVSALIETR